MPEGSFVRYLDGNDADADASSGDDPDAYLNSLGGDAPKARTRAGLMNEKGQWLNQLEVKDALQRANPEIPRSRVLCGASGRYYFSRDQLQSSNSTKHPGPALPVIKACRLSAFLKTCPQDQLVLVACLRDDNRQSRRCEKILQAVADECRRGSNGEADFDGGVRGSSSRGDPSSSSQQTKQTQSPPFAVVKVEMSESREMAQKYNIQALPFFMMFYNGENIVYGGTLGGQPIRIAPTSRNSNLTPFMDSLPRVLLVEPHVRHQISTEKMLKRESFQWELALNGAEALAHMKRLSEYNRNQGVSGGGSSSAVKQEYGIVLLSDQLTDDDVKLVERAIRGRDNPSKSPGNLNTLLVGLTSNPAAAETTAGGVLADHTKALNTILANVVSVGLTKPMKAIGLQRVAKMWAAGKGREAKDAESNENWRGITKHNLWKRMVEARLDGTKGRFLQFSMSSGVSSNKQTSSESGNVQFGVTLETEETRFKGSSLNRGAFE